MLAASTGVRQGEALGLEIQHVHFGDGYIAVVQSWRREHGFAAPKWGSTRVIPLPAKTAGALADVIERSRFKQPDALVFSNGKDPRIPPNNHRVLDALSAALAAIGISQEDRKRRNVGYHSWRHYANTRLRTMVPDAQLRKLTGHKSAEMTETYYHPRLEDLTELRQAQESLVV